MVDILHGEGIKANVNEGVDALRVKLEENNLMPDESLPAPVAGGDVVEEISEEEGGDVESRTASEPVPSEETNKVVNDDDDITISRRELKRLKDASEFEEKQERDAERKREILGERETGKSEYDLDDLEDDDAPDPTVNLSAQFEGENGEVKPGDVGVTMREDIASGCPMPDKMLGDKDPLVIAWRKKNWGAKKFRRVYGRRRGQF
jgi:hypothetical protein